MPGQTYNYDAFLSHASEDTAWCEDLAERLRLEGARVWFDAWELKAGDHLLLQLNEALEQSRMVIAVWSANYFRDDRSWTVLESFVAQHEDPLSHRRGLIPLLLDDCVIPPTLRSILFIDFRPGVDFDVGLSQLLNALKPAEDGAEAGSLSTSPKTYLEERIRDGYRFISKYEGAAEDGGGSLLTERYREVLRCYLGLYEQLCRRLRAAPVSDIIQLARTEPPRVLPMPGASAAAKGAQLYTTLPGTKIIRVGVSQMFRIADLLTRPASVRAKSFYEAITNIKKMRRTLNQGRAFQMGDLGQLRPVVTSGEEYDRFWRPALPDLRLATSQPLCFLPYELSLASRIRDMRFELGSVLEGVLPETSESILNNQLSGRLRIYPPGTGIVTLGVTLEFKEEVHIETVARLAHNIEELMFVDPDGLKRPYHRLMLEVIDQVIERLFKKEGLPFEERRWLPPTTTYTFYDGSGFSPQSNVDKLAYLMSLAPGNREETPYLDERVQRAVRSPNWWRERALAVAGQGVALFFVSESFAQGSKGKRKAMHDWLIETHELISAAAYAQQSFAEEIEKIYSRRLLDETWLPGARENYEYLKSLLETMRLVMRAVAAVRQHLQKQGAGVLMSFAKDLWTYSNPVDYKQLRVGLTYVGDWLRGVAEAGREEGLSQLASFADDIQAIAPPFVEQRAVPVTTSGAELREMLENRLLEQLREIEQILQADKSDAAQIDTRFNVIDELRGQLGL